MNKISNLSALTLGLILLHWPILTSGFTKLPGDLGDTRFVLICLEHSLQNFWGLFSGRIWDAPWQHPLPSTLAYSDSMIGALPFYAPWRIFFAPEHAMQLFILSCSVTNYFGCQTLLKSIGFSRLASLAGAFLFAFAMPRGSWANHPQLAMQLPSLLFALWTIKFFREGSTKDLHLAGAALAWQLWAGIYLGWFLGFAVVLVSIYAFFREPKFKRTLIERRYSFALLFVGLGLLLLPLAYFHSQIKAEVGARSWDDIRHGLLGLGSYFIPHHGSWFYSWMGTTLAKKIGGVASASEKQMFAGFVVLVLPILTWRLRTELTQNLTSILRWALVTFSLIFLFTLHFGKGITLFHLPMNLVPGADAIRAMGRIYLFLLIPLAIMMAYTFDYLRAKNLKLAWLLLVVVFCENLASNNYAFEIAVHRQRLAHFEPQISRDCTSFFISDSGRDHKINYYQAIDAMWLATNLGIPTMNGGIGNAPKNWPLGFRRSVNQTSLASWLASHGQNSERPCLIPELAY